ncbi:MAG TPA: hypothetical protein VE176_04835 [Candidatus Limnocylindrales bacterium]|nr:hypothetical protein [Candidatus Limnocylindrales bacterium]
MMSEESRSEVLAKMVQRYEGRGRLGRSRLLDEVCELCGYERKYAIKLLGGKTPISGTGRRRGGPRPRYGEAEALVVKAIWLSAEQPCGKRLKATVPLWLADYEREQGGLEAELRERVLQMSAATLDRLLAPARVSLGSRGRCGTRPGTLLRKQIPIRTEHWDVSGPGWLEADTVAHCGESMAGDFCWSVTLTDVHTQWTEARAVWNRGQHAVQQRIEEVEAALPFAILGFDSDNGGEFINWHLADYFLLRKEVVAFTRSRAYRKNDNARVEQKNWTHVRQLVGYGRLADPAQAERLNDLYVKEWNLFRNFYCPVMKHVRTEVEGSRKKRVYDKAATPFERLKASTGIDPERIVRLEALMATLRPFALKRRIEKKLRQVLKPLSRARLPAAA